MENEKNYEYISEAVERGKLSHAYIIEGADKEAFAVNVSTMLLCNHPVTDTHGIRKACGQCPACVKASTKNHPDLIHVHHEKPSVVSVGEIRTQVVADISIKPYYGPYKIYIIYDADLMNESAQNALLKTIEEPEDYGVIFLLSDNAQGLLQTIRSRCITMRMDRELPEQLVKRLLDEDGQRVLEIFETVPGMDALTINKAAKEMEAMDKQKVLELARLWFRDLLVFKSTKDNNRLFFYQKRNIIEEIAGKLRYEGLNRVIEALKDASDRLDSSVKAEAVYESLLLMVRGIS